MKTNKILSRIFVFLILFLFSGSAIFAAGDSDQVLNIVVKIMTYLTLVMVAFVLWLALVYSEKEDSAGEAFKKAVRRFLYAINPMPPLDREEDIMLDHDYDGIKELDNIVPPWFNFLFYGSAIFGVIYLLNFHVIDDTWSSANEYATEMEAARIQREVLVKSGVFINENSVELLTDAATLNAGKEIYVKNCVSCHGQNGEGLVGPNMTDEYWVHGGGIKNVFKTIKYGVTSKGMIAWETQLNPKQMQSVANYILSLQGTNPPNAKAPEGEKWIDPATTGKTEL
ncbi:MAG: cbb3-type cytochrome c oxidase N-terminal domain-containing protein [Rhodothermaceae bacterium]